MDRQAFETLSTDETLGPYVESIGPLTVQPAEDIFARLIVSVVRQQLSMEAAAAICDRLTETFEVSPASLHTADPDRLRSVGLSSAKVESVQSVARVFDDREYDREYFADRSDEAVLDELTDVHGIGPWTGKMFLLFCLGRPDVFPVEDLGIRRGMEQVTDATDRREMVDRATDWKPYRSYASLYLWQIYES